MQVLLLVLGGYVYGPNPFLGDGPLGVFIHSGLRCRYCLQIMVTTKIGKHDVEMYDSIEELPIVRFHKYQKLLLVDSGVGSDISAFDQHTERMRQYLLTGKPDKAQKELENLRQCVFLIQSELSPRHRAFAALVTKVDGRECKDISDDALDRVLQELSDAPIGEMTARLGAVKKKIDAEMMLYFPRLFNDSEVKEYFDIMRRRTLSILENIVAGEKQPDGTDAVRSLTARLITYTNPGNFVGSEGLEIQYDRQFENLCLAISENLHANPKGFSVLEFYNAFDFLQERAKQARRAGNGRKRA